ncbi:hypothetical protein X275_05970 [Marinitoga sp. 1197]|uniref:hypothetical protein n=1 Tax=unclassified Marinitoga TaxID=2640159 RepID=UPI000640C25D|nr:MULTISPECIES: hypothetical protein [unclassified Marinitoga]KLO21887.1 hypothetical protein X274_09440 [Marinitoga sp. 1155]KLO22481.1 hypothetical protein X275_05970 [Marinitoga sp. 1197]
MMKSYVKYYEETKKEYHDMLNHAKRPQDVVDVFTKYTLNFLKKTFPDRIKDEHLNYIVFDEETEEGYSFEEPLMQLLKDEFETSDLPSILRKKAKEAKDRYLHIINDNDRTGTFRLSNSSKNY